MKLLVVAHGEMVEIQGATDFVNSTNGRTVFLGSVKSHLLVNLDHIRESLKVVDALVVIQCRASAVSNGSEESELQRLERLAVSEAGEARKLIALIGARKTLFSRHLIKSSGMVNLVGVRRYAPDEFNGIREHFHFAEAVPINNMGLDARLFIERLSLASRAAA